MPGIHARQRQWKMPLAKCRNSHHWRASYWEPTKELLLAEHEKEGTVRHMSSQKEFHFDFMTDLTLRNARNTLTLEFNEWLHCIQVYHFFSSCFLFYFLLDKFKFFNVLSSLRDHIKSRASNMSWVLNVFIASLFSNERRIWSLDLLQW